MLLPYFVISGLRVTRPEPKIAPQDDRRAHRRRTQHFLLTTSPERDQAAYEEARTRFHDEGPLRRFGGHSAMKSPRSSSYKGSFKGLVLAAWRLVLLF